MSEVVPCEDFVCKVSIESVATVFNSPGCTAVNSGKCVIFS